MANVRQMPQLYLRGSLANITMAGLTREQQDHINVLFPHVINHPEMQRHRVGFLKELKVTIAADYSDDREIAAEEYKIAVWKGIVELFYHHKYSFRCAACEQSQWVTKYAKPKLIDRIQPVCPNCKHVEVLDPGDVPGLVKGQFMHEDAFQECYKDLPSDKRSPKSKSPIRPVTGIKKYANPQDLIDDPKQLRKFFGEFVWNYFRQQINENKRKQHRKEPVRAMGDTDELMVAQIISLCTEKEVEFEYCPKGNPRNGKYSIMITGLLTPPEFTAEFARLKNQAELYGVRIDATPVSIDVYVNKEAPPLPIQEKVGKKGRIDRWQVLLYQPEHVSVLDNLARVTNGQEPDQTITQISYRTVGGGENMDLDDHTSGVENNETLRVIRDGLPEGHCQDVFDILTQQGDTYMRFSAQYGDGEARINHISVFLGITTRAVNMHKETIRVLCHANELVPLQQ